MQSIARELNLAETAFLLPPSLPECAAKLRIFTPTREMEFAGHPTIGASFVLLDEGTVPQPADRFVLEENVGPVPIRAELGPRPLIWLTTPPIADGPTFDRELCASVLGLTTKDLLPLQPQRLSAGNPTIFIGVKDKETVDRAWVDLSGVKKLTASNPGPVCTFVFTPTAGGSYSRMFAPEHGVSEDPATGSATGPLVLYMMRNKLAPSHSDARLLCEQGTKMGRRSILHVHVRGEKGADGIDVGGYVTPLVRAEMQLS